MSLVGATRQLGRDVTCQNSRGQLSAIAGCRGYFVRDGRFVCARMNQHPWRSERMEHKQTIVLRKDLNMRKGKMIAQGAHASMRAILMLGHQDDGNFVIPLDERLEPWLLGRFKKVCVSVNSEAELLALHEESKAAGLIAALIQDAGLTEFGGVPTYTALAVGPDRADRVDAITGALPLL
jgi:PTH2 family peptidyl-tRNA hydrolase